MPASGKSRGYYFRIRLIKYEIEKAKPITAYPIATGVRLAGMKIVKKPRPAAATNITRPTKPRAAALFNFEFCHIFPARAIKVIPIIRIDQIISLLFVTPSRSRKTPGAISSKSADKPKTIEPAFKVCLTPC